MMPSKNIRVSPAYAIAIDHVPIALAITDQALNIVQANEAFTKLATDAGTAFTNDDMFSWFPALRNYHNDISSMLVDERNHENNIIPSLQLFYTGRYFDLHITRYDTDHVEGLMITCVEITEREKEFLKNKEKITYHLSVLLALTKEPSIINGDFDNALQEIATVAATTLNISRVNIWRFADDKKQLNCLVNFNHTLAQFETCVSYNYAEYPLYFDTLLKEGIVASDDVFYDAQVAEFREICFIPLDIKSMMDVVIRRGEQIFGVICFEQAVTKRKWSVEDHTFARSISDFITLAYETSLRKETQLQLLESETRLDLALKAADLGTWDYYIREDKMIHNKVWAEMLGYHFADTEVNLQFGEKLVHPDDIDEAREVFQKHINGETPYYEVIMRMLSSNGEWRWIQDKGKVVEWDKQGNPVRASGIQHDITPIKLYQQQVLQQRIFMQEIINAIPNLIYVKNKDGGFVVVNNALAGFLGELPDELMKYPDNRKKNCHAVLEILFEKDVEAFISGKPVYIFEQEVHNDFTGRMHWLQSIKVPLKNTEGQITEVLSVSTDITEMKKKEHELSLLNNNLEQKVKDRTALLESANKELETFNYSVSHDLRTPLRTIDIFAYLLEKNYHGILDKEGSSSLVQIRKSIGKMSSLIDNLLMFSKVGRAVSTPDIINTKQLADDVIRELNESVSVTHVDFRISNLPDIRADYFMIRQAMLNLLANAVKFTRTRTQPIITITGSADHEFTTISISDNGVGFNMDLKDKLFKAFKRLHSDEQFEGTGVGLAIVERIIKRHGGTVWAESEEHKGSTFYFRLPV